MLDRSFIGFETAPQSIDVEKGQLKFFAKATGETNPVYFDEKVARDAGHPALPAPPTFLFCLQTMVPDEGNVMGKLGVNIGQVLHGEQQFTSYKPIHAGDTVTIRTKIADMYEKKGGALEFIVQETEASNQRGEKVGVARTVIVVRNDQEKI